MPADTNAILRSIDDKLAALVDILSPAPRRRGRPPKQEAATLSDARGEEAIQNAERVKPTATKDAVRSALEEFRTRLRNEKIRAGIGEKEAASQATSRVLEWLKTTFGATTLADLKEEKFSDVVRKAARAK